MYDEMKDCLQAFVRRQESCQEATVESLRKMSGGASKETWAFDLAISGHEPLALVVRVDRRSHLPASIGLKDEFALMTEVYGTGIPVSKPYWYGKDNSGRSFYVIERIEGQTIVKRFHRGVKYEKARNIMPVQLRFRMLKIFYFYFKQYL
jgi:aminoglycoside phosphotransferase (APT) family kinase protein